jgi:hypothetical protein
VVNVDNLAIGVSRRRGHANADVTGKNIMLVIVELGINVDALTLFKRKLRGLRAVMENVGALIKVNRPMPAAIDLHSQAVAHTINAADGPANQRGGGGWNRRRIKDGIMAVSSQGAGSGRAIKNLSLRFRRGRGRHLHQLGLNEIWFDYLWLGELGL